MNKKEIAEVKKTFKADKCCIDKVCACYVMPNKERIVIPVETFSTLDDDSMEKYMEIFKKSISGTIGKQLNCLSFPTEEEYDGGTQNLLYELEKSSLTDSDRVEELFDKIIDNYDTEGYYCILVMHANYDVIAKASDDAELDSTEVYSHIICSVCPTNLSKPVLSYNQNKNKIEDARRSWVIEAPQNAFLFPTFTDRQTNIHEVLVFNKKTSEMHVGIIEGVLGCKLPVAADVQVDAFVQSTQAAFSDNITYEQANEIYDSLAEKMETSTSEEELSLSKDEVKKILEGNDAVDLDAFEEKYSETMGDGEVFLENLLKKNKYVLKMEGITITANENAKGLISMKEVDGVKSLVILPGAEIEVNGIPAKV